MPDTPAILYWDSDVFLSYVNEIPGRIPTLEAILESSARGDITIYTSTITQVEVAFAASEQRRRSMDSESGTFRSFQGEYIPEQVRKSKYDCLGTR